MCGALSYVDKANGENYGYCVQCMIGTFAQSKDHNLLFAAPELRKACLAPALDNAHDELSLLLEDDDAGNGDLRNRAKITWTKQLRLLN